MWCFSRSRSSFDQNRVQKKQIHVRFVQICVRFVQIHVRKKQICVRFVYEKSRKFMVYYYRRKLKTNGPCH